MSLVEHTRTLTRTPPKAQTGLYGEPVQRYEIPYSKTTETWQQRVMRAAPGTHSDSPALVYGRYFPRPKRVGDYFILTLVRKGRHLISGDSAQEYADKAALGHTSPHHLFDAIEYLGPFNKKPLWNSPLGPGIVVTKLVRTSKHQSPRVFTFWHHSPKDQAMADIKPSLKWYDEATLFAFIEPQHH